jgi:SAM-dependent methyltransferase
MANTVSDHYTGPGSLAELIAESLRRGGKDPESLSPADLASVDEFHVRGRKATLELAEKMRLNADCEVLDIGSGLGGPARTLVEAYNCRVTGVDLTEAFCEAAAALSEWVNLGDRVSFQHGDATDLPFAEDAFDASMTIHVAMNIPAKDKVYSEARRVTKPGGVFAVYDILQGEGGNVIFPVPWAREASISHLATPQEMQALLEGAGFAIVEVQDSTEESKGWFEAMAARIAESGPPPVTFAAFLGEDFSAMTRNQVRNLAERRIRTVTYICEA